MKLLLLAALLQNPVLEPPKSQQPSEATPDQHIVPKGTVIPVNLTSRISTKNMKEGDGIYAQTAVPITINDEIVIPAGSFLRGKIAQVKQPGRISGRAEMSFNFQTLILPSGLTLEIFASLGGTGGAIERRGEATVVADKGNDGEEILGDSVKGAGGGAVGGAVYAGASGAAKGAVVGGAAGAAGSALAALIRKGAPLVLEPGTMIEIVLDRELKRNK